MTGTICVCVCGGGGAEVPGETALDSRLQVRPEALRSRHLFRPLTHLPLPRGPCTLLFAALRQVRYLSHKRHFLAPKYEYGRIY